MLAHIRLGRFFGVGLHYSWFIIPLFIMFWLGGVAGIEKEDVDRKTKLLMGVKGKPCAAGVLRASAMICRGPYPPLLQCI
jgi:hypothetical protein